MKKIISAVAAAAALAMASSAMADGPHGYRGFGAAEPRFVAHPPLAGLHEINLRQANQRDRIEMGFRRGAINRWEYRRLMAEQQEIQGMERAFVADGFLSPHERMELNRRLDMASHHIRIEATDFQRRF